MSKNAGAPGRASERGFILLFCLQALVPFFAGAALFSFMNAAAWRLPRGQSPLDGRSACPACGHVLGAADLVPVLGWLALRGRCRYCGEAIPVRYLLAELVGGALGVGCLWRFGPALTLAEGLFGLRWEGLLALVWCGLLGAVALIDAETMTIPDRLNLLLAAAGLVGLLLHPGLWTNRLLGALCVSVPMLLLCLAVPGGFGGGDIKLMAAAGLFLGWQRTLLAGFLALVGGGSYGIWLLAAHKAGRRDHFAFGPFLCAGLVIALLFGEPILRWYFSFL
ncbi:MAG: prepilin peptidase [Rikenellaceae bacterium]|nr:prepilin peptidase [Rikenellaceae bacterium]